MVLLASIVVLVGGMGYGVARTYRAMGAATRQQQPNAWFAAVVAGDYTAARAMSSMHDPIFVAWMDRTDQARRAGSLDTYRIVRTRQHRHATS